MQIYPQIYIAPVTLIVVALISSYYGEFDLALRLVAGAVLVMCGISIGKGVADSVSTGDKP